MNRTTLGPMGLLFWLPVLTFDSAAQEPGARPDKISQDADVERLVAGMEKAEAAATKIRLELVTEGKMPGGLEFQTRGSLRVLRTEQDAATAVHSVVEYSFADGLAGRMESVRRPDGVRILERNPTFGEVYVAIDPGLLADLEWAGEVLGRDDLPGMGDSRAASPLGSSMVKDLATRYQLARLSHNTKNGQDGTWYGGDRRIGPGDTGEDDSLPLADRVELFVRDGDLALLEVVFLQAGRPVQRITVKKLVLGEAMPLESFEIDAKGVRLLDVREHPPMWEQIEHLLEAAEQAAADQVRPSRREKTGADGK